MSSTNNNRPPALLRQSPKADRKRLFVAISLRLRKLVRVTVGFFLAIDK